MSVLDKKINSHLTKVYGLTSGFLFLLLIAQNVDARDFFSKQYGLPCKQCHTKIPDLKKFGQNFRSNGYSLTKRASLPKETPMGSGSPAALAQLSAIANTKENANRKSKEDSAPKMSSSTPAHKTKHLYRWQTKGGTSIFTDNPLHIHGENTSPETKRSARTSSKGSRRDVNTGKSAFSGMPQRMDQKNITDSEGTVELRKRDGLDHAVARQSSSIGKAQPGDFEKCMEKILIEVDQPQNAKETMELFEMAERSCAPFAARR